MQLRLVQSGRSALALGFLISPALDAKLRLAFPGIAVVATLESGLGATLADVAKALKLAALPPDAPLALFGYSAGCQGVRGLLSLGLDPAAVACFDGTHSSLPIDPRHLAIWRARVDAAARSGPMFLATTLAAHDYVERLPVGAKGRAASTAHVLSEATGVELRATASRPPSGLDKSGRVTGLPAEGRLLKEIDEEHLHVFAYASSSIDHAEHAYQGSHVMPDLLARYVGPFLSGWANVPEEPTPTPGEGDTVPAPPPAGTLGERALDVAKGLLASPPREIAGTAADPRISAMLYPARRGGSAVAGIADASGALLGLSSDETAWCAAFGSFCLALALQRDDDLEMDRVPHGYRLACWELVDDARKRGTWKDVASIPRYVPKVGDLVLWRRDGGDPRVKGQTGHVGRIAEILDDQHFTSIEGNHGNTVAAVGHRFDEADLVGFVSYPA